MRWIDVPVDTAVDGGMRCEHRRVISDSTRANPSARRNADPARQPGAHSDCSDRPSLGASMASSSASKDAATTCCRIDDDLEEANFPVVLIPQRRLGEPDQMPVPLGNAEVAPVLVLRQPDEMLPCRARHRTYLRLHCACPVVKRDDRVGVLISSGRMQLIQFKASL